MDIEEYATADAHLLLRLVGDLAMRRGVRSHRGEGLAICSTHAFSRSTNAVTENVLWLVGIDVAGTTSHSGREGELGVLLADGRINATRYLFCDGS